MKTEVFALDHSDEVVCAICRSQGHAGVTYKRGEAYLCEPGFFSVNADYICKDHAESTAQAQGNELDIVDVYASVNEADDEPGNGDDGTCGCGFLHDGMCQD